MPGALPRSGSISASDPAYDPYLARVRERFEVRLNGRPILGLVAYDCDEGWVRSLRYRCPKKGHPTLLVLGGIAREQLLHGTVTARWR